ncbi:hypothetical protein T484DRAFT_1841148, partial [Baffinella frigidus]
VKCVTGLAGAHALRVLTLHSNPVSESPAYRAVLLSMCPGLLALDGAVRSDVDTLPSAHRLVPPLSAFASLHRSGLPALPLLDQASSLEAHALAHLRMLLGAHRVYATAGAPLIIQRDTTDKPSLAAASTRSARLSRTCSPGWMRCLPAAASTDH